MSRSQRIKDSGDTLQLETLSTWNKSWRWALVKKSMKMLEKRFLDFHRRKRFTPCMLPGVDKKKKKKNARQILGRGYCQGSLKPAFQKIYKRGPLKWPQLLQVDPRLGRCFFRDRKPQNSYPAQACWHSRRLSHCWTFQPHPCRAPVRPPVGRGNATLWGTAVRCVGEKASQSSCLSEQRSHPADGEKTCSFHQRKICFCKAIDTVFEACSAKEKKAPLSCPSPVSLPTRRTWRFCKKSHRSKVVF